YSRAVINATGLGSKPNFAKFDPASRTVLNQGRIKPASDTNPDSPPRVQTVEEYFDWLRDHPDSFRLYGRKIAEDGKAPRRPRIAVIGKGNSSDTALESLLGFGPAASYGNF